MPSPIYDTLFNLALCFGRQSSKKKLGGALPGDDWQAALQSVILESVGSTEMDSTVPSE